MDFANMNSDVKIWVCQPCHCVGVHELSQPKTAYSLTDSCNYDRFVALGKNAAFLVELLSSLCMIISKLIMREMYHLWNKDNAFYKGEFFLVFCFCFFHAYLQPKQPHDKSSSSGGSGNQQMPKFSEKEVGHPDWKSCCPRGWGHPFAFYLSLSSHCLVLEMSTAPGKESQNTRFPQDWKAKAGEVQGNHGEGCSWKVTPSNEFLGPPLRCTCMDLSLCSQDCLLAGALAWDRSK